MSQINHRHHGGADSSVRYWRRLARWSSRMRADLPFVAVDTVLVSSAYLVLLVLRFDGPVPDRWQVAFRAFLPMAIVVQLVVNGIAGLYGPLWRHAGIDEAQRLLVAACLTEVAIPLLAIPRVDHVPLSVSLVGPVISSGLVGVSRFQARLFALRRSRAGEVRHSDGLRVVVLGAGNRGAMVVAEMLAHPELGMSPVGVLDDDVRTHHRTLMGVPVLGPIAHLGPFSATHRFHQALLAMPTLSQELVQRAAAAAEEARIPLRIVPTVADLPSIGGRVDLRDVRDLQIDDLLGRREIQTDLRAVKAALAGRRVLVTGGGGSIGAEIVRQVHTAHPAQLVVLDHDETHLHDVACDLPDAVQVLADIRDGERMHEIFARYRPEVVFHAAAHKHVPLLEGHPREALETNIKGTANVLAAATGAGVERVVLISTDKAVRPSNVMGASKRMAERLLLSTVSPGQPWCAVRFGNVLGSRGSVVPTFSRQILNGGPVTVTDHRMTRYFMSIPEAVELVLQAGTMARGGELFMLDMGEPVRIIDLARRMIRLAGRREGSDVEVRVTGRRAGEKLSEQLWSADETVQPTSHPAIVRGLSSPEHPDMLRREIEWLTSLAEGGDDAQLASALIEMAQGATSVPDTVDLRTASRRGPRHLPLPIPLGGIPAASRAERALAGRHSSVGPTQS